jgi:5-methylcytosine-specific restriction endonuclease McrBC GTP-binding regulatory subunit McrB
MYINISKHNNKSNDNNEQICSYLESSVFCKYKAHCLICLAASAKLIQSQKLYNSTVCANELRAA